MLSRLLVTCWERADLFAIVCDVSLYFYHFHMLYSGQVWCLIVSIPDLCRLSYFEYSLKIKRNEWLLVDKCPQAANNCALF